MDNNKNGGTTGTVSVKQPTNSMPWGAGMWQGNTGRGGDAVQYGVIQNTEAGISLRQKTGEMMGNIAGTGQNMQATMGALGSASMGFGRFAGAQNAQQMRAIMEKTASATGETDALNRGNSIPNSNLKMSETALQENGMSAPDMFAVPNTTGPTTSSESAPTEADTLVGKAMSLGIRDGLKSSMLRISTPSASTEQLVQTGFSGENRLNATIGGEQMVAPQGVTPENNKIIGSATSSADGAAEDNFFSTNKLGIKKAKTIEKHWTNELKHMVMSNKNPHELLNKVRAFSNKYRLERFDQQTGSGN